jgi:hypothetical protein
MSASVARLSARVLNCAGLEKRSKSRVSPRWPLPRGEAKRIGGLVTKCHDYTVIWLGVQT